MKKVFSFLLLAIAAIMTFTSCSSRKILSKYVEDYNSTNKLIWFLCTERTQSLCEMGKFQMNDFYYYEPDVPWAPRNGVSQNNSCNCFYLMPGFYPANFGYLSDNKEKVYNELIGFLFAYNNDSEHSDYNPQSCEYEVSVDYKKSNDSFRRLCAMSRAGTLTDSITKAYFGNLVVNATIKNVNGEKSNIPVILLDHNLSQPVDWHTYAYLEAILLDAAIENGGSFKMTGYVTLDGEYLKRLSESQKVKTKGF